MRTTIATATFVLFGAGAAAVGALNMQGSDTLKRMTTDIINNHCPAAAGITYVGGGSGTGAFGMLGGTQQVSPMSRKVNAAECPVAPGNANYNGFVAAFDALSIAHDSATAPTSDAACALTNSGTITIDPTLNGVTGLQCPKSDNSECPGNVYTIQGWQDVLRIIYADNSTSPGGVVNKSGDCNSDLRWSLVNNWGKLFAGTCNPATGGAACAQLKHAFRRDDLSGTTDAFLSLLGLQGVNSASLIDGQVYVSWNNPFCNGGKDTTLHDTAHGGSNTVTNKRFVLDRTDTTGDASSIPNVGSADCTALGNLAKCQPVDHFGDHFATYLDNDPIRRSCTGDGNADSTLDVRDGPGAADHGEQVCGAKGNLGIVLVVSPADNLTAAENYPTASCSEGFFKFVKGPDLPYGCPNGTKTLFGSCYTPAIRVGSTTTVQTYQCLNELDNTPVFSPPGTDGRVYNLHVHKATGQLQLNGDGLPVIGAWNRLHSTASITGAAGTFCAALSDATDQIGCLVHASPCSIGFAGHSVDQIAGADAFLVNGFAPTQANVEFQITGTNPGTAAGKYPLARKLYFNSLGGLKNATGAELGLAKCYADDSGAAGAFTGGGGMRGATGEVVAQGFFNTSGSVATCETMCGAPDSACTSNAGSAFPTTISGRN
jgi:hypothetical protein